MARAKIRKVGETTDGRCVIHGGDVFRLQDTNGIPLEISLDRITEANYVVSWLDWWDEAMGQGWTELRAHQTLSAAWGDVLGPDMRVALEERLEKALTVREAYSRASG